MIVRIQLGTGRRVQRKAGKNRHLALACGALLAPVALVTYVIGFWRIGSDMGLLADSGITGIFSHWQVAIAAAALLHLIAWMLNRYARRGEFDIPSAFKLRMLPLRPAPAEPARDAPAPARAPAKPRLLSRM